MAVKLGTEAALNFNMRQFIRVYLMSSMAFTIFVGPLCAKAASLPEPASEQLERAATEERDSCIALVSGPEFHLRFKAFLAKAPTSFFLGLSIVHSVFPVSQQLAQALELLPAQDALEVEAMFADEEIALKLRSLLSQISKTSATQRPRSADHQVIRSKIDLALRAAAGSAPHLLHMITGSKFIQKYLVDLFFEMGGKDSQAPTYARAAATMREELNEWSRSGNWPERGRGKKFHEFVQSLIALSAEEMRSVLPDFLFRYILAMLERHPQIENLSTIEVFQAVRTFVDEDVHDGADAESSPALSITAIATTVLSDLRIQSGQLFRTSLQGLLQAELSRDEQRRLEPEEQLRRHQDEVARRAQQLARAAVAAGGSSSPSSVLASVPVAIVSASIADAGGVPLATDGLVDFFITNEARKEIDVLQPINKPRMAEFQNLAAHGVGPLQTALRTRQGSWQLRRAVPRGSGSGLVYYSVRLDREIRIGFRVVPGTQSIEIVAVNKTFSRTREM